MDQQEESRLARDLLSGREGAFDRFVDHFRAKLYQYSWLMCGQREDAEEVAQETLLKVFENAQQMKEPEKVRAWVFRIAKNACLTKRRKSVFAPARELSLDELMPSKKGDGDAVRLEIADWSAQPEGMAQRAEMRVALEAAIRALPDLYRSVLLLRDMEELSTQETAHILDVTEDVVKTRLHRARLAVRKSLDEHMRGAHAHA